MKFICLSTISNKDQANGWLFRRFNHSPLVTIAVCPGIGEDGHTGKFTSEETNPQSGEISW
jgi:6-phosphogluconolactonase/glucosamine-6-phosphate isomerase/deaminase